jgi:hypothetical protein
LLDRVAEAFGPEGPAGLEGRLGAAGVDGCWAAVGALATRAAGRDRRADSDQRRLNDFVAVLELAGRLEALAGALAAELDASGACERATGATASAYAASDCRLTRSQASRLTLTGRRLTRRPATLEACLEGTLNPRQADAVARAVETADAAGAGPETLDEMEHRLLEAGAELDSQGLAECGRALFEALAPGEAQALDESRAEAAERRALAERRVWFADDGWGVTHINGRLPAADGELLRRTVEFYAAQGADPSHNHMLTEPAHLQTPDKGQRLADGLVAMAEAAAAAGTGAGRPANPPRVVVTCDLEDLRRGLAKAALPASGRELSASGLRLLACQAEVVPAVMGGDSQVLDLGRAKRLASPALRQALALRDMGCCFPGCDLPPDRTEVHHVNPWWAGGPTNPSNTCLLCRFHHRLVEPDHLGSQTEVEPDPERWEVRMEAGLPTILPPQRVDWERKPRRHQRHRIAQHAKPPDAKPPR